MNYTKQNLKIPNEILRQRLLHARAISGKEYELGIMSNIANRRLPLLEMIEDKTGVPIVASSMEKSKGRQSGQSEAILQHQRGITDRKTGLRIPDAIIEFLKKGSVVDQVYALEVSLQNDLTRIGSSNTCNIDIHKPQQLALTMAVMASKPEYKAASLDYIYMSPWEPTTSTETRLLVPLQNLNNSDRINFTWLTVD